MTDPERPGVLGLAGQHDLEVRGKPQPSDRVCPVPDRQQSRSSRELRGGTAMVSSVSSVPCVM